MRSTAATTHTANTFELVDARAYAMWRAWKLSQLERTPDIAPVEIGPDVPVKTVRASVSQSLAVHGAALYHMDPTATDDGIAQRSAEQLYEWLRESPGGRPGNPPGKSLASEQVERSLLAPQQGMTRIEVDANGGRDEYIPYTNKAIGWHTDGYYSAREPVRSFALHCVCDAAEGGHNSLIDPELIYLRLRDQNPAWIRALMQDFMHIPANVADGVTLRPAATVPVFAVCPDGELLMRFSARKRHVEWPIDSESEDALEALRMTLEELGRDAFQCHLAPGHGLLSNNALHKRTAFANTAGKTRLILRARFFTPFALSRERLTD